MESILDKKFRTSDGRLLFVEYNAWSNHDELVIHLGSIGRFPFTGKDWDKLKQKCIAKLKSFIKELDAVEI